MNLGTLMLTVVASQGYFGLVSGDFCCCFSPPCSCLIANSLLASARLDDQETAILHVNQSRHSHSGSHIFHHSSSGSTPS